MTEEAKSYNASRVDAELADRITALEAESTELKARIDIVTDGFKFAADEIRPMFGLSIIAAVFDAVYEKLKP